MRSSCSWLCAGPAMELVCAGQAADCAQITQQDAQRGVLLLSYLQDLELLGWCALLLPVCWQLMLFWLCL